MSGTLTLQLLFGQGISDKDADVYVKIKVGSHASVQSRVAQDCRSPVWNETFTFAGLTASDDRVEIKVFKVKGLLLSREEMLGTATVSLAAVRQASKQQASAPVIGEKGRQHGAITVDLEWRPNTPPQQRVPSPDKAAASGAYYPQAYPQASAPPATGYPVQGCSAAQQPQQQPAPAAGAATPSPQVVYVVQQQPQPQQQQAPPAGCYPTPTPYTMPVPYPGAPPPPAGMGAPYGYAAPPPVTAAPTTVVVNEAPQQRRGHPGAALAAGMVMGARMERRHIRRAVMF